MKKLYIIICTIFLIIYGTAKAYDNFDNNYHYGQISDGVKYSRQPSPQDEVLFIVDFSSSMNSRLGYSPKAYLAIDAIRSILGDAAKYTKIGLRTFGISNKTLYRKTSQGLEFDEHAICTASDLVIPISRYSSNSIADRLSRINPHGGTPIGYSLRQAVSHDFSAGDHLKHIILVTDGEENCGDDPCMFISNLMRTRKDFRIDVIGITVNSNAYSQLNCIANVGGGNYYSIDSEQDFKLKFKQAFDTVPHYNATTNPVNTQIAQPSTNNFSTNIPNIRYKTYGYQFYD